MKIGILGLGKIAERHIAAYKKIGGVELVANDRDKAKSGLARRYGITWVARQNDIIKDDSIRAIDVCVPNDHHFGIIDDAMDHDKDVFCEKPFVLSVREGEQIKKKAEKKKRIVAVGYLYRFHPGFKTVKEALDDNIIGRVHQAVFRLGGRGSHRLWKHKKKKGGGVVNEMLVHMLDLMYWYFGEPDRMEVLEKDTVLSKREIDGRALSVDAEDTVLLKAQKGGLNILFHCDLVTPSYINYIEIHGSNGSAMTSILAHFPTFIYCKDPVARYDRGHNFFRFPKVDLFQLEIKAFLERLNNDDRAGNPSVEQSIMMLRNIKKAGL